MVFNSIADRQMEDIKLKPQMFCDVVRLTPRQTDLEVKVKEQVLKMANDEVRKVIVCVFG